MIKLNKSDFDIILPLTKDLKHNRAIIFSVIEGSLDGQIYVDDPQNPTAALISWEFSFLLGTEKNVSFSQGVCTHIFSHIIPNAQDHELILFMDIERWPHLNELLTKKGCIKIARKMFSFNADKFEKLNNYLSALPPGFKLEAKDCGPKGFGYFISNGTHIISRCESVAVGANQAEIDVFTDESHRTLGFATKAAAAFIRRCIQIGITPVWSCWPERHESINLAKKLGFEETEDIPVVYWAQEM